MKEYKRKFADAESRLDDLRKRCVYDEDQLRIIHAWCLEVSPWLHPTCDTRQHLLTVLQLVERVQLMADGTVTNSIDSSGTHSPTSPSPYMRVAMLTESQPSRHT